MNGLINISGAVVDSWSTTTSGISLSVSGDKSTCNVSGYASNAKLIVTIRRVNGLLEKFEFEIGQVGVPSFTVEKVSAYCAGNNYEITTKINHYSAPGISYSYSYNIPPLQNSSYVIKSGAFAYWVFKAPETVNYSATLTFSQAGCSSIQKNINTYVYSLPCGGYYKSTEDEITQNIKIDENKTFIYPNPASNKLIVNGFGDDINIIRIYNIAGVLVYSAEIELTAEIDISYPSKGIYFVECFTKNNGSLYQKEKLIIE